MLQTYVDGLQPPQQVLFRLDQKMGPRLKNGGLDLLVTVEKLGLVVEVELHDVVFGGGKAQILLTDLLKRTVKRREEVLGVCIGASLCCARSVIPTPRLAEAGGTAEEQADDCKREQAHLSKSYNAVPYL